MEFLKPVVRVVFMMSLVTGASLAQAKDLSHRLGVGFKNQFSNDVPGVALQFYPGADLGLSVALGVDTAKDNSKFGAMAKLYRIVFHEDNANFYMGAGAGLITTEVSAKSESGFELLGFVGVEFFLPGLENVGFSFEAGPAVTSVSSGVRFRTFGDSPLRAGILFYF